MSISACETCNQHGPWHKYDEREEVMLALHRAMHDLWRELEKLATPLLDWIQVLSEGRRPPLLHNGKKPR